MPTIWSTVNYLQIYMVGRLFLIFYGSKLRLREQSSSLPMLHSWYRQDLYLGQSGSKNIFVQPVKLFHDFFFPHQALMSQLPSHLKASCHPNRCFCLMLTCICNEKAPFNGMLQLILKQYFLKIILLPNFRCEVKAWQWVHVYPASHWQSLQSMQAEMRL